MSGNAFYVPYVRLYLIRCLLYDLIECIYERVRARALKRYLTVFNQMIYVMTLSSGYEETIF